jgi:predicted GNAT family N-acyltransferase
VSFAVRPVADAAERAAAMAVRQAVFVEEQGISIPDEFDDRDDEAEHLVVVEEHGGAIVATCRVFVDDATAGPPGTARLGRLAVLPRARHRGLASAMIAACEARARAAGATVMVLDAQVAAMPLYARAGYTGRGEPFDDAGIPHLTMDKRLDEPRDA